MLKASLLGSDHPLYLADKAANFTTSRYVDEVYLPQSREINTKYRPDLIWSDGDWERTSVNSDASSICVLSVSLTKSITISGLLEEPGAPGLAVQ